MTKPLLAGLALARGCLLNPAGRDDSDWFATAMSRGGLAVDVYRDSVSAVPTALSWRRLDPTDAETAVLLGEVNLSHVVQQGLRDDLGRARPPGLADPSTRPLIAVLRDRDWYESFSDAEAFDPQVRNLREIGAELGDVDAAAATTAVALSQWHTTARYCTRCGGVTELMQAGWSRRCQQCQRIEFPRTDAAVIVLVRDSDDRALLGSRTVWPSNWYSTLAGFVEAGESAEGAVVREMAEEAGVQVDPTRIVYRGSQPWPFPRSLMLGFHAWTDSPETAEADGEEIRQVRWVSRAQFAELAEAQEVLVPPPISIARRLIEDWYGQSVPGVWGRS